MVVDASFGEFRRQAEYKAGTKAKPEELAAMIGRTPAAAVSDQGFRSVAARSEPSM
jgi:hypothetical protein